MTEGLFCVLNITFVFLNQDNYTFAQPGIQIKVKALEELVSRIDGEEDHVRKHRHSSVSFAGTGGIK